MALHTDPPRSCSGLLTSCRTLWLWAVIYLHEHTYTLTLEDITCWGGKLKGRRLRKLEGMPAEGRVLRRKTAKVKCFSKGPQALLIYRNMKPVVGFLTTPTGPSRNRRSLASLARNLKSPRRQAFDRITDHCWPTFLWTWKDVNNMFTSLINTKSLVITWI